MKVFIKSIVKAIPLIITVLKKRKNKNKILFLVTGKDNGFASGLRGYSVARQLADFDWDAITINEDLYLFQVNIILYIFNPDFIYLQKLRSPLNDINNYPNYKCILDVDDADYLDERSTGKYIDNAKQAALCIAGSENVANWLKKYNTNVQVVWTSSQDINVKKPTNSLPIICWATSTPFNYPIEAEFVKNLISKLKINFDFQFYLIGVKNQEEAQNYLLQIDKGLDKLYSFPFVPYKSLLEILTKVDIGLAPIFPENNPFSSGKSFGKVLAYLNTECLCVASNNLEHRKFFDGNNGLLCDDSLDHWYKDIEKALNNRIFMKKLARQGKKDYREKLTLIPITKSLSEILYKEKHIGQF